MKKTYIKVSDAPKHPQSPFHQGTETSLNIRKFPIFPQGPMVNRNTGEIVTDNVYMHKKFAYKDYENPIKVWSSMSKRIYDMSPTGIKTFFYVLERLNTNIETIYLNANIAAEWMGYSSSKDVYKGVLELINMEIIGRTQELHLYYVNPNVLFLGNKMSLLREKTE